MPNGDQQITRQEFAARIKKQMPELERYTDDSVVDSFLAKNPNFRQYVKEIPPLPLQGPATTIGPPPPWYVRAGRETVEALPALGATIGGLATSETGPAAVAGAALGGAGGESARELIERGLGWKVAPKTSGEAALRIGEAGAEQGIWEILGNYFKPFRAGRVAGAAVSPEELFQMSRTPGFKMTASQIRGTSPSILERTSGLGMWSREAIEAYKQKTVEGAEKLAKDMLDGIAPRGTPQASGQTLKDALDTASAAFKREGQIHYAPFRGALGEKVPTSFDSLVQLANDMERERTALVKGKIVPIAPGVNVQEMLKLPPESPADTLLHTIKNLKEQPQNFKTAMEVRDYLHRYLPGRDQLFADKESEAMAKRFWKRLGDQLSDDARAFDRANPGETASPKWEAAKEFWSKGRERFDSTFYRGLMRKNPELVAKALQPGNVTDVKLLKSILTEYGSPAEIRQGEQAWRNFQRTFAEQRFLGEPGGKEFALKDLQKMKGRMDTLGGPQLREIYSDPGGQEFLRNARAFAELMNRTDFQGGLAAGKWEVMYDIVGLVGSGSAYALRRAPEDVLLSAAAVQGVPRFLTAMFHSRPATALFLRSIMLPPKNKTAIAARIISETVKGLQRPEDTYEVEPEVEHERKSEARLGKD